MKKKPFFIGALIVLAAEIAALVVFAVRTPDFSQDAVAVNEVVQTVTYDFADLGAHSTDAPLDYVVIDNAGNVLYRTDSGLSETLNAAIAHRDTILDIESDGTTVGKVIIYNGVEQAVKTHKQTAIAVMIAAIALECAICAAFACYMHFSIVKPFRKLEGFAERVAGGNLDIPLEMDRQNIFGAFTESFDVMRAELKKARLAEAQAQNAKKELVAKLSHDVKTPIASIKAVAEVGAAVATTEKDKNNYESIILKADWINTLVTNLFSATLEELQQLPVSPTDVESTRIRTLLENADYMHRAEIPQIPECLAYADGLRLQQVFDNIFANSYKYANTAITVAARRTDDRLVIEIEDFGGGVRADELPYLKEKYKRGSNATNVEGAGLGLFISDYFMREMGGELEVENGANGLKATVSLALSSQRAAGGCATRGVTK